LKEREQQLIDYLHETNNTTNVDRSSLANWVRSAFAFIPQRLATYRGSRGGSSANAPPPSDSGRLAG
jgi:hypothetical protein